MHQLDYSALGRGGRLGTTLRAVGASFRLSLASAVGAIMTLVGIGLGLGFLTTHNTTMLLWTALLLGGGGYVIFDVRRQAGGVVGMRAFARANRAILIQETSEPAYAGSYFADAAYVQEAVRTPDADFVEVGNQMLQGFGNQGAYGATSNAAAAIYLRAALPAPATPMVVADRWPYRHTASSGMRSDVIAIDGVTVASDDKGRSAAVALFDADLITRLHAVCGGFLVEIAHDEATVFGTTHLDVDNAKAVQAAYELIDHLVERIGTAADPSTTATSEGQPMRLGPAGFTLTLPPEHGVDHEDATRRRAPGYVLAGLWLLVAVIVIIAWSVALSLLFGNHHLTHLQATLALPVLIAPLIAVGYILPRRMMRRHNPEERPE